MPYYVFLFAAVLMMLALSWALWSYTHSIAFPFGMALLYFWSLHGAWAIVTDQLGGDSQMHYHYLYDKMFPVYLDENYAWTLALYAAFILIVALTALLWVRPACLPSVNLKPVVLSHDKIIVFGGFAALMSLWIVRESLGQAAQTGVSAYAVTRSATDNLGWFRIHQVLNRVALVPASIGFATLVAGGRCRYLAGDRRFQHYAGYAGLLGFMFCFCVVLGNKNELALALFAGCLFYIMNSTRPKMWQLATSGTALLACVGFIDFARGLSIDDLSSNVSVGEIANSLVSLADSNEAFAAHMSLYGVLDYELPLTNGSSVYSLLASVVPRALWPDRPYDIYWYYANGVAATEGQGYSIHHAAGWYLKFGVPGIVFGAFLLGRLWAALYNNVIHGAYRPTAMWWRIFCIIGFFTFTANLPSLIRAGPEGYKAILVDSFFVPVAILTLSRAPSLRQLQTKVNGRSHCLNRVRPSLAPPTAPIRPKILHSREVRTN